MSTNRIVTLFLIAAVTLVTVHAGSAVFRRSNAEMAARDEFLEKLDRYAFDLHAVPRKLHEELCCSQLQTGMDLPW